MSARYQRCSSRVRRDSLKSIRYTGPSMNPTLKSGDRLEVIPFDRRVIRRGDVVVFRPPEGGREVAHRVIGMERGGIRTRGDNSWQADDWLVSPADVIGCVVSAQRGRRRIRIYGGGIGRWSGFLLRSSRTIRRRLWVALRPLYTRLVRPGILKPCIPARLKTRVVRFRRPSGTEMYLFLGRRLIGSRAPGKHGWRIRPLFRLFVDETVLYREPPSSRSCEHEAPPDG
jgi:hypothetical protein